MSDGHVQGRRAPEQGYPIEMKVTSRSAPGASDPTSREHTFVTRRIVLELSREPLDSALFEIPAGFRAAEGRPAAFAARWSGAWQMVKGLVAGLVR